MNVETIYKTSEEKFVGEYIVYAKKLTIPGLGGDFRYPYADPEHTEPIYADQLEKMMDCNVRIVTTQQRTSALSFDVFCYLSSSAVIAIQKMFGESFSAMQILGVIGSVRSDGGLDAEEERLICMDKDMYETVVGGALPMALNEDDEPVSFFERGKRLLEAYAAYMEDQNDAE